jgi:mannose-6-phosphate isomerase-like protein (cupin superfamily)
VSRGSQYLITPSDWMTLLQSPLGAVLMLGGNQTAGRLSVLEHRLAPRPLGSPVNTHRHEDEYSVVLEGVVGAQIAEQIVEIGPGAVLVKPRGVAVRILKSQRSASTPAGDHLPRGPRTVLHRPGRHPVRPRGSRYQAAGCLRAQGRIVGVHAAHEEPQARSREVILSAPCAPSGYGHSPQQHPMHINTVGRSRIGR